MGPKTLDCYKRNNWLVKTLGGFRWFVITTPDSKRIAIQLKRLLLRRGVLEI